jgi:uncharacterized protein involved in response to NO
VVPSGAVPGSGGVGGHRRLPAVALLLISLAGLAQWAVGVVAATVAAALLWRVTSRGWRPGRLWNSGIVAGLFCGYAWLASVVVARLYPS